MPWTVSDVDSHKKGLTPVQKKKWVSTANSVLKDCQSKGGKDCEGKAIRIANSKFSEEGIMEKKTMKIPMGAMRFVSTESHAHIELAEGTDAKPKMNMIAYSGKIIKGHWYWDDLVIDLNGMVFDKAKYPVLEQHDRDRKIAFTGKPVVTPEFTLKIDENKTVFVDTEVSREFQKLSVEGFPYESSIYVTPLSIERLDKGVSVEVNGFKMKGPGTIFRKSRFNEASVCVFGWDRQTQASAFSKEEVDIELEEENVSLTQEGITNLNNRKEVTDVTIENVEQLSKEYPDLIKRIQDAVKAEMETAFSVERTDFQTKLAAKDVEIAGQNERVLKLEKNDTIRTEKEIKNQANSIWTEKLSESDIPAYLYDKVRAQISYSKFVKDSILDVVEFSKQVDDEIKDWIGRGVVESKVLGAAFTTEVDKATALLEKKIEDEDNATVNKLLKLAGQEVEEKKAAA